jgi:hypothetical protein
VRAVLIAAIVTAAGTALAAIAALISAFAALRAKGRAQQVRGRPSTSIVYARIFPVDPALAPGVGFILVTGDLDVVIAKGDTLNIKGPELLNKYGCETEVLPEAS